MYFYFPLDIISGISVKVGLGAHRQDCHSFKIFSHHYLKYFCDERREGNLMLRQAED